MKTKTRRYKLKNRKTRRGGTAATEPGFFDRLFGSGSKPEVSGVDNKTVVSIKTEVDTLINKLKLLLKTKNIELTDDMTIDFIKQKST